MTTEPHDGNDVFWEITPDYSDMPLQFTYLDLWMAMVLNSHFDNDWDRLLDHFRHSQHKLYFSLVSSEGYLNHARHLRQALETARLAVEQVLAQAGPDLLRREKAKARRKILEMKLLSQERSYWMIHTPRLEREERALHGYWDSFPVSPAQYAGLIKGQYKPSGFYTEDQSFGLERKLSKVLEKHEAQLSLSELFALHRAFLTVVLEKMDAADDSYGVIGDIYEQIFLAYISLDRTELAMPLETFLQDLLELLIWEDYGFTHQAQPDFFAGLPLQEVPTVEQILQTQWGELRALELDYQAERALTMLGLLYSQQGMLDRFLPAARLMRARQWQRITRMAETAESRGQPDLALAVYEAALGEGLHDRFLREKYEQLKERMEGGKRTEGSI